LKVHVPEHIESLVPYPPGKPLEELEREYGISGSIKLASNENPWGPSPKAMAAIRNALTGLHRYPDGSCYYLTRALAERLGVAPEEIVFGNGSNEVIGFLVAAFLRPGEEVITSHPSFLMYQKFVQVQGGVNRVVQLNNMQHDLQRILSEINDRTRLIFLDIPNNPTGSIIRPAAFEAFLDRVPGQVLVVLDEAYVDFVDPAERIDAIAYIHAGRPVVALRTFSKAYGLSGLRLGYGIMAPELAGYLHRVRQPFNVNSLAQVGGLAALADEEHYQKTLDVTRAQREWLMAAVAATGCRPIGSHTNFFLIDVGGNSRELYENLLRQGVIVRPMQAYGYPDCIRITVGLPAENERFVKALVKARQELGYG
jgi:histidinol-phosphate aminotransferase